MGPSEDPDLPSFVAAKRLDGYRKDEATRLLRDDKEVLGQLRHRNLASILGTCSFGRSEYGLVMRLYKVGLNGMLLCSLKGRNLQVSLLNENG